LRMRMTSESEPAYCTSTRTSTGGKNLRHGGQKGREGWLGKGEAEVGDEISGVRTAGGTSSVYMQAASWLPESLQGSWTGGDREPSCSFLQSYGTTDRCPAFAMPHTGRICTNLCCTIPAPHQLTTLPNPTSSSLVKQFGLQAQDRIGALTNRQAAGACDQP
jgi:hypothetical protein